MNLKILFLFSGVIILALVLESDAIMKPSTKKPKTQVQTSKSPKSQQVKSASATKKSAKTVAAKPAKAGAKPAAQKAKKPVATAKSAKSTKAGTATKATKKKPAAKSAKTVAKKPAKKAPVKSSKKTVPVAAPTVLRADPNTKTKVVTPKPGPVLFSLLPPIMFSAPRPSTGSEELPVDGDELVDPYHETAPGDDPNTDNAPEAPEQEPEGNENGYPHEDQNGLVPIPVELNTH